MLHVSSWSRERTKLLGEEHKVRIALVLFLCVYLSLQPNLVIHVPAAVAAILLMAATAIVAVTGVRPARTTAATGFEVTAAVMSVLDLVNVTLLVFATAGAASPLFLLYPLPLLFAAAFFRGLELALLAGLACGFYGLTFMTTADAAHGPWLLALRLATMLLISWLVYALANVLHGEKQGNDQLLRHLTEGVVVVDGQDQVALVNQAFAAMFGLTIAQTEGADAAGLARTSSLLEWVLQDAQGLGAGGQRTTRIARFPEEDLPLLEVTTIACQEHRGYEGGWVIVCRDLRDEAADAQTDAAESCDGVSPLSNLRALSQTLYALAERLEENDRWRAVAVIEQHTVAMQAILAGLLQHGSAEAEYVSDCSHVSVCGLLSSTRRVLEIRDQELRVSIDVKCSGVLPDLDIDRGALGRLVLRVAKSLLHFARPSDRLVLSGRLDGDRVVVGAELCPPRQPVLPHVVLEQLHDSVARHLRMEMDSLSRVLVQCGAVWTLRRVIGDYHQIEVSLPQEGQLVETAGHEGTARTSLAPLGEDVEYLRKTTLNRLNNALGIIRGHAELALLYPQEANVENALAAAIEKADQAAEVLEVITAGAGTGIQGRDVAPADQLHSDSLDQSLANALPVLIVDDDAGVREMLAQMFMALGCGTAQAADAQAAIDYLQEQKPALALVDLHMPGAQGTEVLKMARQWYPDLPVVMMSGLGNSGLREALDDHVPDGILGKPFSLNDVMNLVRDVQNAAS